MVQLQLLGSYWLSGPDLPPVNRGQPQNDRIAALARNAQKLVLLAHPVLIWLGATTLGAEGTIEIDGSFAADAETLALAVALAVLVGGDLIAPIPFLVLVAPGYQKGGTAGH